MTLSSEAKQGPYLNIFITGQPGSGGSTLAKNMEHALATIVPPDELIRFSGGRLRRAAAYLWHDWQRNPAIIAAVKDKYTYQPDQLDSTTQQPDLYRDIWIEFELEFGTMFAQNKLLGLLSALDPYFDRPPNESILQEFNHAQQKYTPNSILWDFVTETYLAYLSQHAKPPYRVGESKLLVYADRIRELQELMLEHPSWALPTLRLMLVVDPAVAAARISQRENEPVTAEDVLRRRHDDWQRYTQHYTDLYTGEPLTEEHLKEASFVIDTTDKDAEGVLAVALSHLYDLLQFEALPEVYEHQRLLEGVRDLLTGLHPTPTQSSPAA